MRWGMNLCHFDFFSLYSDLSFMSFRPIGEIFSCHPQGVDVSQASLMDSTQLHSLISARGLPMSVLTNR